MTLRRLPSSFSRWCEGVYGGPLLIVTWGFAIGVLMWGSGIDVAIQEWLHANYVQKFNDAVRIVGQLGKGTVQVSLCLLVGAAWGLYNWVRGHVDFCGVYNVLSSIPVFALAGAINWILKWGVGRGRPKEFLWHGASPYELNPFEMTSQWWSFPSGHSCSAFVVAVWLGLSFPRWKYLFWSVAVAVSFSRFLAITPHYFGDVVAGASVGAAVALLCWNLRMRARGRKACTLCAQQGDM